MEDEEKPREGKRIEVFMPEGFLQEAAKRGVTPAHYLGRVLDLHVEVDGEARQLFDDWDQRPTEERLRWCFDAARERVRMEFPYLDKHDEQAGE